MSLSEISHWRSVADQLAEALKNVDRHNGLLAGERAALERYEKARALTVRTPLPEGPATHVVTFWRPDGTRKKILATSVPRVIRRPGKQRFVSGNSIGFRDIENIHYEWNEPLPEGTFMRWEKPSDRVAWKTVEEDARPRVSDYDRVADEDIFENLTGEHVSSTASVRPWDRTSADLGERARRLGAAEIAAGADVLGERLNESGPIVEPSIALLRGKSEPPPSASAPKVVDLLAALEESIAEARAAREAKA